MKKKILHFVSGLEVGGTEMQILRVLPILQKNFDNRVCCFGNYGPIAEKLQQKGIEVYCLNFKGFSDLAVFWRMRKVIKRFKPDIMVTYLIHCDLIGRFWGRIFGIKKIICSQRGSLLQWEYLRFLDRLTKFLVTKYTVQTEVAKKKLMKKLRLPENKFVVIPNGINLTDFDIEIDALKKKTELGIIRENLNITCVGNLRRGKGHEYLLKAFEKVFEKKSDLNLLIVGDGEKKEELLKQVASYKSKENIYFLGHRNDVKEILKISDIFVLATEGEGMCNTILEAMASKIPIITTDIPENRELLQNEESVILVKTKNSQELVKALTCLINDEVLAKKLADNAFQRVKNNFAINITCQRLEKLFEEI